MITYIEKLLNGQSIEWKKLGEATEIKRGKRVVRKELDSEGRYPVFQNSMTPLGYYYESNVTGGTVFVIAAGAAGEVGYSDVEFWAADDIYYFTVDNNLSSRYLYHYLLSKRGEIDRHVRRASIPRLSRDPLGNIPIPIPPLSVQEEIVRILDKFTELEAKLEAELEARKQQYEYYRNSLLSFANDLEGGLWKPLGEACEVIGGFAFKSSLFKEEGMPIIRIGNITASNHINMDDSKCFNPEDYAGINFQSYLTQAGDILIAMSGATTGKIGYYTGEEVSYINQRVSKLSPKSDILNNRFLYHYLLGKSDYLYHLAGGGAQPNLSAKDLRTRLLIPLPPLAEQERIARILDKFDTLTTSLTEGLPQEIELRRKQYEYYREQLLSFPA